MSKNGNIGREMTLVELAIYAGKLSRRIESMNVRNAADPDALVRVQAECKAEAISEAANIERNRETAKATKIPSVQPISRAPSVGKKEKGGKRTLSKEHLAKLAKSRDAYFKKKGFGKYAKKSGAKEKKAA